MARRRWAAVAAVAAIAVLGGCSWSGGHRRPAAPASGIAGLAAIPPPPGGPSWAPRPVTVAGLRTLATASGGRFDLRTAHGDAGFLAGVNLGSTTPGHQPGELAITTGEYRDWLAGMGRLGARVLRIYTIHPPAFYDELRRYNTRHPQAPLYLMQGVYLPDESYVTSQNLYARAPTEAFTAELRDAVAAVHGALDRSRMPGHASGHWRSDVSRWLAGWVAGVEWDPVAIDVSDRRNAAAPRRPGRYFTATPGSSPTERWLAARLDELAAAEAAHGDSQPIAFVNWPTTDPLRHPEEPLPNEDRVGIDANHVRASAAWPGGTFASYHAYPYYPDFQRYSPALAAHRYRDRSDPYAGYLAALRAHHAAAGLPVIVTELGVPASLGQAHTGPLGRDQGAHTEQEAMRMDAELLHVVKDTGLAGALLFAWADEWFKLTWNTVAHQLPADRRQLWHDALTNEQWFGLVATDPTGYANPRPQRIAGAGPARSVTVRLDEGYVRLELELRSPAPVVIGLDPLAELTGDPPAGTQDTSADVALTLDPVGRTARLRVRRELDAAPVDLPGLATPPGAWISPRLVTNRAATIATTHRSYPVQLFDLGSPRWGTWDPADPAYDSRAQWHADGTLVAVRLPWALLSVADPSSHTALLPGPPTRTARIESIGLTVSGAGRTSALAPIRWQGWERVAYRERLKAGARQVRDAIVEVTD